MRTGDQAQPRSEQYEAAEREEHDRLGHLRGRAAEDALQRLQRKRPTETGGDRQSTPCRWRRSQAAPADRQRPPLYAPERDHRHQHHEDRRTDQHQYECPQRDGHVVEPEVSTLEDHGRRQDPPAQLVADPGQRG